MYDIPPPSQFGPRRPPAPWAATAQQNAANYYGTQGRGWRNVTEEQPVPDGQGGLDQIIDFNGYRNGTAGGPQMGVPAAPAAAPMPQQQGGGQLFAGGTPSWRTVGLDSRSNSAPAYPGTPQGGVVPTAPSMQQPPPMYAPMPPQAAAPAPYVPPRSQQQFPAWYRPSPGYDTPIPQPQPQRPQIGPPQFGSGFSGGRFRPAPYSPPQTPRPMQLPSNNGYPFQPLPPAGMGMPPQFSGGQPQYTQPQYSAPQFSQPSSPTTQRRRAMAPTSPASPATASPAPAAPSALGAPSPGYSRLHRLA